MSTLKEFVECLARSLVNDPDAVAVREVEGGTVTVFELSVAPDEVGRVIGRGGRVVNAMVTVLNVAAAKEGKRVEIEILKGESQETRGSPGGIDTSEGRGQDRDMGF